MEYIWIYLVHIWSLRRLNTFDFDELRCFYNDLAFLRDVGAPVQVAEAQLQKELEELCTQMRNGRDERKPSLQRCVCCNVQVARVTGRQVELFLS